MGAARVTARRRRWRALKWCMTKTINFEDVEIEPTPGIHRIHGGELNMHNIELTEADSQAIDLAQGRCTLKVMKSANLPWKVVEIIPN